jgi:hypothetical protein
MERHTFSFSLLRKKKQHWLPYKKGKKKKYGEKK